MEKTVTKSTSWLTVGGIGKDMERIEMKLDQKQFAKLLGVSQGMISRWESRTYNFTITTLINICEKLGLSFKPQITSKEVKESIVENSIFTIFKVIDYSNDRYSEWIPNSATYYNNIDKVGAVA